MSEQKSEIGQEAQTPKKESAVEKIAYATARKLERVVKTLEAQFGIDIDGDGKAGRTSLAAILACLAMLSAAAFGATTLLDLTTGDNANNGTFTVVSDNAGATTLTVDKVSDGTTTIASLGNLQSKVTAINIGGMATNANTFAFVAPYAATITDVKLVLDTATEGSTTTSDRWGVQVANLTRTNNLLSAVKYTSTASVTNEWAADTSISLGVAANATLAAGDVIELQFTKTGDATDLTNAKISAFVFWR